MLNNIEGITKEELDIISQEAVLDSDDCVVLSSDNWTEKDGIRYLKKTLKVHRIPWSHYNLDCASLVSEVYDPEILYVFAFSTTEESTMLLSKLFQEDSLRKKGYCYFYGLQREELCAID